MLKRATLLGLLGATIVATLVVAGGPAGATPRQSPNVAWATHRPASVAQTKAEEVRTLHSFGMTATPGAVGMKSAATVHPADVPMYYHRCWSFIDATFHVNTKRCPGDVYRFSTYNGEYEAFDAQFIAMHQPYNNALDLEKLCYSNWACATTMNTGKAAALFKGYRLVGMGARTAWSWFKVGWEWFWGIYGPNGDL